MRARVLIPAAIVVGVIVAVIIAIASEASGVPMEVFTRDIGALSADGWVDLPFQAGLLTMLTVVVWAGGGAMALFAATFVRSRRA